MIENHLSHPWPHATAGENVEISSFLIFYKYSAATRINLTPAHQRGPRLGLRQIFTKLKLDTVHTPGQANDSNDDNDSNDQSA